MSHHGQADRSWGAKAFVNSAFKSVAHLIDCAVHNMHIDGEDEYATYVRLADAALKQALLDAEAEVIADPDTLGTEQQVLLYPQGGQMEIRTATDDGSADYLDPRTAWANSQIVDAPDMVAIFCRTLDLNVELFRDYCSNVLDRIADRVRAERAAAQSAEVFSIAEARQRRMVAAARQDALPVLVLVPVRCRRRHVGDQYAWAI